MCAADVMTQGRKGSVIGARRLKRGEPVDAKTGKPPPTNEEVAQAVQEKVAVGKISVS